GTCVLECPPELTECSGACVDTDVHPDHCGACGEACPTEPGATGICVDGACVLACAAGTADCNADLGAGGDGCETPIDTDADNCGVCGRSCTAPNATTGCAGGACILVSCEAGLRDCDGSLANGCEVDVTSDELSCGACGTV